MLLQMSYKRVDISIALFRIYIGAEGGLHVVLYYQ